MCFVPFCKISPSLSLFPLSLSLSLIDHFLLNLFTEEKEEEEKKRERAFFLSFFLSLSSSDPPSSSSSFFFFFFFFQSLRIAPPALGLVANTHSSRSKSFEMTPEALLGS